MTTDSNLYRFAQEELTRAGLLSPASDYDGDVGAQVLALVDTFTDYGHSGGSALAVLGAFNQVVRHRPLSPLTDNPDEWEQVDEGLVSPGDPPLWQSKRHSAAFSNDGGKSYYVPTDTAPGAAPHVHNSAPYFDPNFDPNQENQ